MKLKKTTILISFLLGALGVFGAGESELIPDTVWTYKQIDGKSLQMFVFLPDNYNSSADRFSIIVFFHGGSWVEGEPSWHYPDCAYWSKRGMIAVSVDYRLRDRDGIDVPLECIKDAKSAIRFLRKNEIKLKVNTHKIVCAGGSAGGQLAAATAMILGGETNDNSYDLSISCIPDALILFNPYFKCQKELSPPNYIVGGLPPIITFLGDQDQGVSVKSMVEFHNDLREAGVQSELCIAKGGKHGFCNGRDKNNRFFYWSLELEGEFLIKHNILTEIPKVLIPRGVEPLLAGEYKVYD